MPRQKPPPISASISGDLRRRVNQIAHAQGMKHELAARTRIVDELHRIAADDTLNDPVSTIATYLKALEGA
ncbi:hypothetical protein [Variovorax sp. J22R115]|uniref:hypothetical protein n=1 Tax=Variovorax sp. J22R115 TaxID=3053509 RepID=UPI0025780102|nr:hypothetical protein [Variovorax sp. J22R115]MDM0051411.1 hypothetical protein [Variovorax sp. J22R115]